MARLEDIREGIYRRDFREPTHPRRDTLPHPKEPSRVPPHEWEPPPEGEVAPRLLGRAYLAKLRERRTVGRWFIGGALVLLAAAIGSIGYTLFFTAAEVAVEFHGPQQVTVGDTATFLIRILNRSSVALTDGTVTVSFPEGTILEDGRSSLIGAVRVEIDVSEVAAGATLEREVRARLVGAVDRRLSISAVYIYRPENLAAKVTREATLSTLISRVPVALTVAMPERVPAGQEVALTVGIDAELSSALPDMALGVDYPPGFSFASAEPPAEAGVDDRWALGVLEPGSASKIVIRGTITGTPEEVQPFRFRLGRYRAAAGAWLEVATHTRELVIASPFLFVEATLAGEPRSSIPPGERLEGTVRFKNNLTQKIQNVTIMTSFPEEFVELKSIRAERGFYDVTRHAIVWNATSDSRLRELSPGEERSFIFSFVLKFTPPIKAFVDKNFEFPIVTVIDSASPPAEFRGVSLGYEHRLVLRVESRLVLVVRAAYFDSPVPNSGPLPPASRQTTTYTVFLQLSSGANDLRDVEVRGTLPGGVAWRGILANDGGAIDFADASGEFVWQVRDLPAATGILRPPHRATIQVALTPAENQVGFTPFLVRNIGASARDTFSGTVQEAGAEDLTTELKTDTRTNVSHWNVVP